ncbi:nuclear transport factor 2 family protein [Marinomonas spartinae]|uniref:nuclear transport factor 2 family protein n=1 Tax=Marinomonas spartinae TaxID=1792290 RepID=UPI001F1845A0|nr:nuclear transport factor 2 family protein [Marinomonas spartinae]
MKKKLEVKVTMEAKQIVLAYWQAMRSNDFFAASQYLAENFRCEWPQSNEVILGRENFANINSYYPANGIWTFQLNSIVVEERQVVTDVTVSDGTRTDRVITFHTVDIETGLIAKQTEFWPENYPAPDWRAKWVEKLTDRV